MLSTAEYELLTPRIQISFQNRMTFLPVMHPFDQIFKIYGHLHSQLALPNPEVGTLLLYES